MDRGRYGKQMLNFCVRVLYNAYVVAKYELWPSRPYVVGKVGYGQKIV